MRRRIASLICNSRRPGRSPWPSDLLLDVDLPNQCARICKCFIDTPCRQVIRPARLPGHNGTKVPRSECHSRVDGGSLGARSRESSVVAPNHEVSHRRALTSRWPGIKPGAHSQRFRRFCCDRLSSDSTAFARGHLPVTEGTIPRFASLRAFSRHGIRPNVMGCRSCR